jgi:hypothetical protein
MDYWLFFSHNGNMTINCLEVDGEFFISRGPEVVVSPVNRIEKYERKGDIITLYFGGGLKTKTDSAIRFRLWDVAGSPLEEFIKHLVEEMTQSSSFLWSLLNPNPLNLLPRPFMCTIDCSLLTKAAPTPKEGSSNTFEVPEDMNVEKVGERGDYIKYGGWSVPIEHYKLVRTKKKGMLTVKDVVKKYAKSFKGMKF